MKESPRDRNHNHAVNERRSWRCSGDCYTVLILHDPQSCFRSLPDLSVIVIMGVPDNGPLIVGVTWFVTLFCGAFLGLRIYAKLSRRQGLWWDDYILILSWVS